MTSNGFAIAVLAIATASFVLGVGSGLYFETALHAFAGAFLLPAATVLIFGGPVRRAWWSANKEEAGKPAFRNEAKQSLRFVIWISIALSLVFGVAGYFQNSIYEGAFAGLLLGMTLFGFTRARDVAAETFP